MAGGSAGTVTTPQLRPGLLADAPLDSSSACFSKGEGLVLAAAVEAVVQREQQELQQDALVAAAAVDSRIVPEQSDNFGLGPSPRRPVGRRLSSSSQGSTDSFGAIGRTAALEFASATTAGTVSSVPSESRAVSSEREPTPRSAASAMATAAAVVDPAMARTRLTECLCMLEGVREQTLGVDNASAVASTEAQPQSQHDARNTLLEEKQVLASAMEKLRATMRTLQEEGELCTVKARSSAAHLMAVECLKFATQDELDKVHGQLHRSLEQVSEHKEARKRLQQQLEGCAIAFSEAVSQEAEAQDVMRHEIDQLRGVTEDLESRLRAKANETQRLRDANQVAAKNVASAVDDWRQVRTDCAVALESGALGTCMNTLKELTIAEHRPPSRSQTPVRLHFNGAYLQPALAGGESGGNRLQQQLQDKIHEQLWQGLERGKGTVEMMQMHSQALRDLVSSKEEQLAALHRKIRFLSEPDIIDDQQQHA
mmetsp:Transcript_28463/g.94486  ORF Transcript_28463/g.94486 Transcript_28463/m.94486 type:complete len:483 (-) Transcript_28463:30-1478(-)